MSQSTKQEKVSRTSNHVSVSAGIWFAILCWGGAYVAARFLLHPEMAKSVSLSPTVLAALRFSIASLFFVIPLVQAVRRHEVSARQLLLMSLLGHLTWQISLGTAVIGISVLIVNTMKR